MKYKMIIILFSMLVIISGCSNDTSDDQHNTEGKLEKEPTQQEATKEKYEESGTSERYQHDADIVRVHHLYEIVNYLEEYKMITGQYPLANGSEQQKYTFIATDEQLNYTTGDGPPFEDMSELESLLNKEIAQNIQLPVDPQKVPVNKPNFYIYMTQSKNYTIAVHLHNEYSFSKNIAPYYNKVEVSSNPNPEHKIWSSDKLFSNEDFIEVINKEMYKEEYFDSLSQ
ncbi:hypothetical protein CEY16_03070 [Halalkalibacillus sediminis]|uniref:Lipoprotein n=1 Tax=Halalkalibacillus sediminis TaxID=2018042 RepID=A0A2I0QWN9_9BACI|nr:hypothetical protein [Halalkalibacillus sediminis]PKR78752.1 hypothetical protein CEY16_03070 [Halalkalibacillus sediminis]